MSAILQETGGPLREERAGDGKLKSRLEWPNMEYDTLPLFYYYTLDIIIREVD